MEGLAIALMVPAVVFMTLVAPIWIFMHYRSKQRSDAALSETERTEMRELEHRATGMLKRIETLESILDAQTPGWRQRSGDL
jgi:phage shock protein B